MLVEKITSGNGQYQTSFSIKNQHLSQSTKVRFISVVFSLPGVQETCKIDYVTCVMLYLDIYSSSSSCSCTDLKQLSEAIGLRRSSTYALSKTWNLWLRRKHAEHVFSLTMATTSHHWSLLIQTTNKRQWSHEVPQAIPIWNLEVEFCWHKIQFSRHRWRIK